MKKIILVSIIAVTILSCTDTNVPSQKSSDNSKSQITAMIDLDSLNIPVNTNLPLGYYQLAEMKYPIFWESDTENYGLLKNPGNKAFENISFYYSNLNSRKPIGIPKVSSIAYLNINDNQKKDPYFDTVVAKLTDSCIYHLPNIRNLECYYFRQYSNKNSGGEYGNLLLVNNKTKAGKVITIYFEYGGEQNMAMRYFLIAKEKINIYEGSYFDDGFRLRKSHQIAVDEAGEISIKK